MRKVVSRSFALAVALVLTFTLAAGPALAAAEGDVNPSADAMIFDTVFLRPLGLVSSVFGGAAFVVSLPFTLASGSTGAAAERLVGDPLRYTFTRPLGVYN